LISALTVGSKFDFCEGGMKLILFWLTIFSTVFTVSAFASQYQVLHTFVGEDSDGRYPVGDLLQDSNGNIYGVTSSGGFSCSLDENGCGVVFELAASANGGWTYSVLYSFCPNYSGCQDGAFPEAGLVIDTAGNLYGTAVQGGTRNSGVIFELSPPTVTGGTWSESVIHNFCSEYHCADGYYPYGKLLFDSMGRLYGTTSAGGNNTNCRDGCGTAFQLTPPVPPQTSWSEHVLYTFCAAPDRGYCPDGSVPTTGLTFDKIGNLYGTTSYGGAKYSAGTGTIYKLSNTNGQWAETVLYAFPRTFWVDPIGELSFDPQGNLYGIDQYGSGEGEVFRLSLKNGGTFQRYLMNSFGAYPQGGILLDPEQKVLYGTTSYNAGTLFELSSSLELNVLYNFCRDFNCSDGYAPAGKIIKDSVGNLFGTTEYGGLSSQYASCRGNISGCGVLFELTP
jgi:uncharacterized repeat protein (TIGR03803 family)